ncbi:MAG: PQQ-binding-like beta-propeller repeat protein, partial [bacterium]
MKLNPILSLTAVLSLGQASALDQAPIAGTTPAVGFRGDGSGVYPDAKFTATWTPATKPVWEIALPGWSNSSPTPIADRIFVMGETNDGKEPVKLLSCRLYCLNAQSGAKLWEADLACDDPSYEANAGYVHGGTGFTTPSPASDGKMVFAHTGKGVVAGLTLAGQRQWIKIVEKPNTHYGEGTSPVCAEGKVLMLINSTLYGLDSATGQTLWKQTTLGTPQVGSPCRHFRSGVNNCCGDPKKNGTFGTPVVTTIAGRAIAITPRGDVVRVADGKLLTKLVGGAWFTSPLVKDGVVYFGNENDTRAYQLPDQITEPFAVKELWLAAKLIVDRIYSSPVYHQGFLYLMDMDCNVIVLDAATGKQVKTFRTQGDGYASLAVAGDTLLAGCISAFSTKDFSELGKIP